MARHNVTADDQGKRVVDANGDAVGMVSSVSGGTAYVDPDPGLADRIRTRLGWEDRDDDDFPLEQSRIDTITEDEIRLKK
jgi:hypothetical protein